MKLQTGILFPCIVSTVVSIPSSRRTLKANETEPQWVDLSSKHEDGCNLIVGGSVTTKGQYPFFVDWGGCGASLIHSDMILTAAHCNTNTDNIVYVGAYRQGVGEQHGIMFRRMHPQFNRPIEFAFDFMVLKMTSPSSVTPIAINGNGSNPSAGESLTVMGHGDTSNGQGQIPDTLLQVTVPYIPQSTCNGGSMYNGKIVENIMFCAGFESGGAHACYGDSGGPIVQQRGTSYVQVGIVSWAHGCAPSDNPTVYARVSGGKTWIEEQICALSSNPPSSCIHSGQVVVRVDIMFDNFPEDTGWSIRHDSDVIVEYNPGNFTKTTGLISERVYLNPGVYTFTISDSVGNGICCEYGNGYYSILTETDGEETQIAGGDGHFGFSEESTLIIPVVSRAASDPDPIEQIPVLMQSISSAHCRKPMLTLLFNNWFIRLSRRHDGTL